MPSEKGKLKPNDYKCIQSNFTYLKENLDADDIIDSLFEADIFTEDDLDNVKSKPTRKEKTDVLLRLILRSGPGESFNIFLESLKPKYPEVERKLRSYDPQMTSTYSNSKNEMFQCSITYKTNINDKIATSKYRDSKINQLKSNCRKKEFHAKFTPFNKISIQLFDHPFKHEEFVKLTKVLGNLVVKLDLSKTSKARQAFFPRSGKLCGTGRITFSKTIKGTKSRHCECKECKHSESPRTEWGEISVITSAHIVYDNMEAKNTTCTLWYNEEDPENTVSLEGLNTVNVNVEHDRSQVIFVTHDMNLVKTLMRNIYLFKNEHDHVYEKYKSFPNKNLAILISHPHGWPKQVSVGTYERNELVHGKTESKVYTYYTYDLQTCPGSAGAPVYFLGKKDVWSMHPHSESLFDGDTFKGKSAIEYESI